MKKILVLFAFVACGCAHPNGQKYTSTETDHSLASENTHNTVFPHPHTHGVNCGHETKTENGSTLYSHDGVCHSNHAGHVDAL